MEKGAARLQTLLGSVGTILRRVLLSHSHLLRQHVAAVAEGPLWGVTPEQRVSFLLLVAAQPRPSILGPRSLSSRL